MLKLEMRFEKGCIYIAGTSIDKIGRTDADLLHEDVLRNRVNRDGSESFHITFMSAKQLGTVMKPRYATRQRVLAAHDLIKHFNSRYGPSHDWPEPEDLGPARVSSEDSVAYYRVVHWPFGKQMLASIGIDHTIQFHVTVGFSPTDISSVYKGPATLDCLADPDACTTQQLKYLHRFMPFYSDDQLFQSLMKRRLAQLGKDVNNSSSFSHHESSRPKKEYERSHHKPSHSVSFRRESHKRSHHKRTHRRRHSGEHHICKKNKKSATNESKIPAILNKESKQNK